jgi:hypothetical protein
VHGSVTGVMHLHNTPTRRGAERKVYECHRAEYERLHPGKYVLIDIRTEKLFLAD